MKWFSRALQGPKGDNDLLDEFRRLNERFDAIDKRLDRLSTEMRIIEKRNYLQLTAHDALLARLSGNAKTIPPLRGFAISPDTALFLLDLLEEHRPTSILELGSGFSSVIFAHYAKEAGARFVSIDSDPKFAANTAALVQRWGLADTFNLVISEIVEQRDGNDSRPYYDPASINPDARFDFVFVDGPAGKYGPTARQGLFPFFERFLNPGCLIVCDDYSRPGERQTVANWIDAKAVDLLEENKIVEKHAAVLRYTGR